MLSDGRFRGDTFVIRHATVRVRWRHDDGGEAIISAKIENASEAGARLRFDQMIPVRSYVSCNDESLGIRGTGSVRYCRFANGK